MLNRWGNALLTGLFIVFLFIFGLYMFITADRDVSAIENRELAQKPKLSLDTVKNGTFMDDFNSYVTDQFPGRNRWLKAYIDYQRLTNQTYIYDYYIGDDNWMLAEPEYGIPKERLSQAAQELNAFAANLAKKDVDLYYFSVPHKVSVMQFLLPAYIKPGSYIDRIDYLMEHLDQEQIVTLDLTHDFMARFSEDQIKDMYFKTDHHWNMNGIWEGYQEIMKSLQAHSRFNMQPLKQEDVQQQCFKQKQFEGSYNKQIYYTVQADDENLCFMVAADGSFENYEVAVDGKSVDPATIYAREFGTSKTSINYSDIFGYNLRELEIINPAKKDVGNKILVIKDSYANPLAYFIAQHYYQTTFYDPRYNQDRTIEEYIEANDFDEVAVIYNSAHLYGSNYHFDTLPK
ncbi:hypothetical protein DX933_03770 [Ornithinibacillus gellani]|uniref:DHHW family protein n=1 Tax=Ornithinibacillus gellani TaxID=2293253 RepID=UPI000F49453E|nr:DHHW family protein [Ornithinibacillus gellani]TQS75953.1 hypothetical protein DX933_03770 [Ornithinibacillus gellani]